MANSSQEAWKARKRAAGCRNLVVWLDREAADGLDNIRAAKGLSVNDAMSQAVVYAIAHGMLDAHGETGAEVAGQGPGSPVSLAEVQADLADVRAHVVELAGRVQDLEAGHGAADAAMPAADSPTEDHPAQKRKKQGPRPRLYDHGIIVERVVQARVLDDSLGHMARLHRQLLAEGVPVPPGLNNFCKIAQNNSDEIDAKVVEARAAKAAAGAGQ